MRTRPTLIAAGAVALAASLIALPTAHAATAPGGTFVDLQNFAAGEPDHIDPNLTSTLVGFGPVPSFQVWKPSMK